MATVMDTDAVSNAADISAFDGFDPDAGNDSDSVSVSGEAADIRIEKSVDNDHPNLGIRWYLRSP